MASSSSTTTKTPRIAVINPNSSEVITAALERTLGAGAQAGPTGTAHLSFHTGPKECPPSINNAVDAVQSAVHTFASIPSINGEQEGGGGPPPPDAYLVCCFSHHPLTPMLRHAHPSRPSMHILEAAVLGALPLCTRFGVVTTGADAVPDIDRGVRDVLGANSSRYVGTLPTHLGVVELQTGDRAHVEATLRRTAGELARRGADAIILGCAGMTGMEAIVRQGAQEAFAPGKAIAVIDGAKAGVQLLAGLVRASFFE